MKEIDRYSYSVRNISLLYPHIVDQAVEFYAGIEAEVIIVLRNGDRYSFDEYEGVIRKLPEVNEMTEEQCLYEFSFRLRRLMYRRGITQEILSERTGISRTLISRYMNGKSCPSFYKVDKIAKAIGCSVEDLRLT